MKWQAQASLQRPLQTPSQPGHQACQHGLLYFVSFGADFSTNNFNFQPLNTPTTRIRCEGWQVKKVTGLSEKRGRSLANGAEFLKAHLQARLRVGLQKRREPGHRACPVSLLHFRVISCASWSQSENHPLPLQSWVMPKIHQQPDLQSSRLQVVQ